MKGYPVHINDEAFEAIVENSLFDFNVWLRLCHESERGYKTTVTPWEGVEDQETRDEKGTDGKNSDRDIELIKTYSRRFEGGNFTISRQPAKSEEDSKEDRNRDSKSEKRRGDEEKNHQDVCYVSTPSNNQFDQLEDFIHQEDNRKGHQSDKKNGENLLPDIEIKGFFHSNFVM